MLIEHFILMFTHSTKEIWKNYNFPHPTSLFTRMPIKQDCYEYSDCAHSSENHNNHLSSPPPLQNTHHPHFYSARLEQQGCHPTSEHNCNNNYQNNTLDQEDHSNLGDNLEQHSQNSNNRFFLSSNSSRRETNRLQQRRRLANETPERRQARLEAQRIQQQLRLASESPEQRAARLLALRERQKFRLAHETPEQRAARLAALRHRQRLRLATETPEQRSRRLEALRIRQRQRIANETPEQRAARLADLRQRQRLRLANETPEKRALRLEALRMRQQQRLASENTDQRTARLAAARVRQQHRHANETREERAARFAGIKRRRRSSCSSVSTCPSIYIPRKLPPPSPPTSPPTPPPPPPPTPFHTPPSPAHLQRQLARRPVNMDAAASDYWWESHFLVPAIQHQQAANLQSQVANPAHSQHHQGPGSHHSPITAAAQAAHRGPPEFVNPVHITWDSMYTLCANNSDANLANHSAAAAAAIFAPFCNIRRSLSHNQPATPLPTPPPQSPFKQEETHANSPNPSNPPRT
ncbi:hypothetical protein B566_EDAN004412 [Ephemera danica]|nr:hypothetical protein B566_EDAN004412 [Ephemera danica]